MNPVSTQSFGTKLWMVYLNHNTLTSFREKDEGIVSLITKVLRESRCRLIASWGCRRSQGLVCSPIKAVRELGSDRRETGRPLSAISVR